MRKLTKNDWRLEWVLLVNGVIILLLVTSPIWEYHKETQIFQALRTAQPPFAFWGAFFKSVWPPIFTALMLVGILAEARRSILSPILNVVPFLAPLIWGGVDWVRSHGSYPGERSLGLAVGVVLFVVGLVNAVFYAVTSAKRGRTAAPNEKMAGRSGIGSA
jgi:hypothetical protein